MLEKDFYQGNVTLLLPLSMVSMMLFGKTASGLKKTIVQSTGELQESMVKCSDHRDLTEITLKTVLNTKQSINHLNCILPHFLFGVGTSYLMPVSELIRPRTLSLLMTTQEAFVDSVDEDQTVQNMQSDLWSALSKFLF